MRSVWANCSAWAIFDEASAEKIIAQIEVRAINPEQRTFDHRHLRAAGCKSRHESAAPPLHLLDRVDRGLRGLRARHPDPAKRPDAGSIDPIEGRHAPGAPGGSRQR